MKKQPSQYNLSTRIFQFLSSPSVLIKASTWIRESHGLFDYESPHTTKGNLKTSSSAKIVRIKNDMHLINDATSQKRLINDNSKILAYLNRTDDGEFILARSDLYNQNTGATTLGDNLWLVVKSIKSSSGKKGYKLQEKDIIKLGRMKFKVRELVNRYIPEEEFQSKELNATDFEINDPDVDQTTFYDMQKMIKINPNDSNPEAVCRICLLQDSSSSEDFLVSPCGCTGSVQLMHLSCLRKWVQSRCATRTNGICTVYYWKNADCEICHKNLPDYFLTSELTKINLFDYPKPDSCNYLVLESFPKEKDKTKTFYVLKCSNMKESIKLGRGHECDLRVGDISVSRLHAFIRNSYGNFYLEDNSSKFGTLILIKNEFKLSPDFNISVQAGRTVISFILKSNSYFNPARFSKQQYSTNYFEEENAENFEYRNSVDFCLKKDASSMKPITSAFSKLSLDANLNEQESESNPQVPSAKEDGNDKGIDAQLYFFPNFQVSEKDKPSQCNWEEAFESHLSF